MKILKYKIAGALYQLETGPVAQVGDSVKIFLNTDLNPAFPESVFGIIQSDIKSVECDTHTLYNISYELEDLIIKQGHVLYVEVTSAIDVVAADLEDEIEDRIAADLVLQDNIDDEETARIAADDAEETARMTADGILQDNIDTEESARIAADGVLQDNIDDEESARIAADGLADVYENITEAGTTVVLSTANAGRRKRINLTNAGAVTLDIAAGITYTGLIWNIRQRGTGVGTVTPAVGVTVNGGADTSGQHTSMRVVQYALNDFDTEGGSV